MASEALDIKTLTTLILATPKTDVTQSIGRILRVKHAQPLVIDIIDPHDVFKKQWLKRQNYYKKQNYFIKTASRYDYNSNKWEIVDYNKSKKNKSKKINKTDEMEPNKQNDQYEGYIGKCLLKI